MADVRELAKAINLIDFKGGNARNARALSFAFAYGFQITVDPNAFWNTTVEQEIPKFKKLLGLVNEMVVIDTKLAIDFFGKVIGYRYSLIQGSFDPAILKAIFQNKTPEAGSATNMDFQTEALSDWVISKTDFVVTQTTMRAEIDQYLKETADE